MNLIQKLLNFLDRIEIVIEEGSIPDEIKKEKEQDVEVIKILITNENSI